MTQARTGHPDDGGWYVDVTMSEESVTDDFGHVGDTAGTVGPYPSLREAEEQTAHFEQAEHVTSWKIRYEGP